MITSTIDMTGFNQGVAALIRSVGVTAREIVEKETGELIKTLVKVSPPRDPQKTKLAIGKDISGRFAQARNEGNSSFDYHNGKISSSGIKWYAVDGDFLRGVAPKNDMRDASVDELKDMRFKINRKGRLNVAFKHPRKTQRVLLYQTILTKESTVKKLVSRIQKNVGRLKAGWLVAANSGAIKLSAGNKPPQWVSKHSSGAQGRFENGLASQNNPSFTIANFAKGIKQNTVDGFVQIATSIRAKAMLKNAELFTKGKKTISDYAR